MSDDLRKGFGEQISEKATPQSQKSYGQTASESLSGVTDKVAGTFQGNDNKSSTQQLGDSVRGTGDDAQSSGGSYLESAKQRATDFGNSTSETLNAQSSGGSYLESVKQTATDLGNSASETLGNLTGSAKGKSEDVAKE